METKDLRRGQHFLSAGGTVRLTILTPGPVMTDVFALTSDSNALGISGCTLLMHTRIILEEFHLQHDPLVVAV